MLDPRFPAASPACRPAAGDGAAAEEVVLHKLRLCSEAGLLRVGAPPAYRGAAALWARSTPAKRFRTPCGKTSSTLSPSWRSDALYLKLVPVVPGLPSEMQSRFSVVSPCVFNISPCVRWT